MFRELCMFNSASGDEKSVRDYIIESIDGYCTYEVDSMGSIIAFKEGKRKAYKKIMLCAHMDEVAFVVTDITDDGYLRFKSVGGVDPKTICGRTVSINDIDGVVGIKPIHLTSKEEEEKAPEYDDLFIDIGAKNKEEALEHIQLGDYAYFKSDFTDFGENCVLSKALDDRIGCMYLVELIRTFDLEFDTYFCFNVQEEIGGRGALCTSYSVNPDIAVVIEVTTANDIDGVTGSDKVCSLGDGPVVSYMDKYTIYDKYLYHLAMDTAKQNSIKAQTKTRIAGGNDAQSIQTTHGGTRVIAISVPCRYIHSGSCVVNKDDIRETRKLIRAFLPRIYD